MGDDKKKIMSDEDIDKLAKDVNYESEKAEEEEEVAATTKDAELKRRADSDSAEAKEEQTKDMPICEANDDCRTGVKLWNRGISYIKKLKKAAEAVSSSKGLTVSGINKCIALAGSTPPSKTEFER